MVRSSAVVLLWYWRGVKDGEMGWEWLCRNMAVAMQKAGCSRADFAGRRRRVTDA